MANKIKKDLWKNQHKSWKYIEKCVIFRLIRLHTLGREAWNNVKILFSSHMHRFYHDELTWSATDPMATNRRLNYPAITFPCIYIYICICFECVMVLCFYFIGLNTILITISLIRIGFIFYEINKYCWNIIILN